MYKKVRYIFYILFNLKAACGLAYRPQAAFAFDRYLSSSLLPARVHDGGLRRGQPPQHAASIGPCDAAMLATLPQIHTHAMARACGHRWTELAARQCARRPEQTAELFFFRYSSGILRPIKDALEFRSDPYPTHEPHMHVPGLLFF